MGYQLVGSNIGGNTGPISGSTGTFTGAVTAASFAATGAITGASLTVSGNLAAANYTLTGLTNADIASSSIKRAFFESSFMDSSVSGSIYSANSTGTVSQIFASSTVGGGTASGGLTLSTTTGSTNVANALHGFQALTGRYSSFRGRVEFWLPTLSDGTDRYTLAAGQFQTIAAGAPSRNFLTLVYRDDLNSGKFQLQVGGGTPSTVDTGVTVAANTVYALDYVVNVTTPGSTASNPFTARVIDVATGTVLSTISGSMICQSATGLSQDTANIGLGIGKSLGTNARVAILNYMKFEAAYAR